MTPRIVEGVGELLEPADALLLAVGERELITRHARLARDSGGVMPPELEGLLRVLRELAGSAVGPKGSAWVRSLAPRQGLADGDGVTVAEAARLKRVAERSVVKALGTGRLHGWQRAPGSPWQVDRSSLSEWNPRRRRAI